MLYRYYSPNQWSTKLMGGVLAILAVITIVLITIIVQIQSAATAYAGGESIWSRAQTSVVVNLLVFSETGDEAFLDRARDWLKIPKGDQKAREAMGADEFDEQKRRKAREGLIQGGNHPDDADKMIMLFRLFEHAPHFTKAVQVWEETDPYISKILALTHQIQWHHQAIDSSDSVTPIDSIRDWQTQLIDTHNSLARLASQFRQANSEASRLLSLSLIIGASILIALMAVTATVLIKRLTYSLTASHRRVQAMVEQTGIGIARTSPDGQLLEVNEALCQLLRIPPQKLLSESLERLIHSEDAADALLTITKLNNPECNATEIEARFLRGDGQWIWGHLNITEFQSSDSQARERVVIFDDVTEKRQLHEKLDHQASHDELTQLHNRRALRDELQATIQQCRNDFSHHTLCFIDLDHFKVINDTVGHEAGDHLLVEVTRTLRSALREQDFIARLGGDEFAIIFRHCGLAIARKLAERIRVKLDGYAFDWSKHHFQVSCSMGLAPITSDSSDGDEVLRKADMACYMAKENGKNAIHSVDDSKQSIEQRRHQLSWVARLKDAIEEDRLWLQAQPIINVNESHTVRYEVLIRALDDQNQPITPDTFIPTMEQFGVIHTVDCWVIEKVCSTLARNPAHLASLEACHINLSTHTLDQPHIADWIIQTIEYFKIPPERLCFEVTETAAVSNFLRVNQFIGKLSDVGCSFALDDFGSGLSSFGYLRALPVKLLKIDGLFVKDIADNPTDQALVEAIISVGKTMGKVIVAEFVEDDRAVQLLSQMGIDYLQGFGVAQPQPLTHLIEHTLSAQR